MDSGPLGKIAHPRPNRDITDWLKRQLELGARVSIPEIADYEVRRNLLLERFTLSVERLNQLKATLAYIPLNTDAMIKAAELWAQARRDGQPTADLKELDGDVILAAQAIQAGVGAVVATENVGHLSRFVDAQDWRDIS